MIKAVLDSTVIVSAFLSKTGVSREGLTGAVQESVSFTSPIRSSPLLDEELRDQQSVSSPLTVATLSHEIVSASNNEMNRLPGSAHGT